MTKKKKKDDSTAENTAEPSDDEEDNNDYDQGLVNGMFNPCQQTNLTMLLYVKVMFNGIEKDMIFDPRITPTFMLPDDLYND